MTASETEKKQVLVIGSGIAGPAVSIALRMAGFDVALHEAWPTADVTAGAWFTVMPNGLGVLRTLGVGDSVLAAAHGCDKLVFRDHSEAHLADLPIAGAVSIRRAVLQRVLLERAVELGAEIHHGKELVDIREPGARVVADFEDGTSAEGDLLLGCDGLRSRVRQVTLPSAPSVAYSGTVSSIGFCQSDSVPPTPRTLEMAFGRRNSFRYLVRDSGEVYWAASVLDPARVGRTAPPAPSDELWRQRLLVDFQDDAFPATEIITSTARITRHPIYRLGALRSWHRGRVCLVGDAAHAVPPYAGQGVAMALEDAVTLAKCLRDLPEVTGAFEAFERIRMPRQARVAAVVRRNGRTVAAHNPVSRWIRNRMIPVGLRHSAAATEWMNSYEIDWDEPVTTEA